MNVHMKTENLNLAINSAKAIGCSVVNIGASDILEAKEYLVLGLIWQIVRIGLLANINLQNHPELFRLLEPGEEIGDLLKLPPEQILLRWFNYHLKKANHPRRVSNFSGDIKDSENYTVLLSQLAPDKCDKKALSLSDHNERAKVVLDNAAKIDCKKFVRPRDIVRGNPKLNLAFVANIFNTCPGLEPLTDAEKAALDEWLFASEGTREARAFCLWINSLGIEPFVNNLFEDLRDGLVILRVLDIIQPGIVDWRQVNQKHPLSKFKKLENTNYAIVLGKQLKFSLVGVGGVDIVDGNQTLTLALVWQMMRMHVLSILKSLGSNVTDQDMINWSNEKVRAAGKKSSMRDFKDSSLKTSVFFLDLLDAIKNCVNYDLVTAGTTDEDATQNAKYVISIARKIGCTIFLLPEDIVEVKHKMILTLVGSIMAVGLKG
jgi:plastin-1